MILEIDAGNTFIKWRVLNEVGIHARGRFLTCELESNSPVQWRHCEFARIASVAGKDVNAQLEQRLSQDDIPSVFAKTAFEQAGLVNSYSDPSRMGVDRWLVMLGAYHLKDRACCVIDCGSAITIDYVSEDGKHEGGYILPGLRLMNKSLQINTAEVIVDQTIDQFSDALGVSTSEAVIHGVNYMFHSLCRSVVDEVEKKGYELFITGGDGRLFHQLAGCGELIDDLVMDGLVWGVESP